ncbi:trypsin-like serine peptidase [Stella humosa]|nr:hypothetical protein [Stella humosa]
MPSGINESLRISLDVSGVSKDAKSNQNVIRFHANRNVLEVSRKAIDTNKELCAPVASASRPDFWREALIQRKQLLRCDKIVKKLTEHRIGRLSVEYFSFLSHISTNVDETLRGLFDDYKENCLQLLSEYAHTRPFRNLFGEDFLESVISSVGLLVGAQTACTASIVRFPGSRQRMLATAAHCIARSERDIGANKKQVVSVQNLKFNALNGMSAEISIEEDVKGWIYPKETDLALIPLADAGPLKDDVGLVVGRIGALNTLDPIYIFGINPIVLALNGAASANHYDGLFSAATATFSTPCRIVGASAGSIGHNCETEKQMSGSPILAIQDNRPAIIGVHVAGLDRPAPLPRCGVGSWPAINYGTFMPEKTE